MFFTIHVILVLAVCSIWIITQAKGRHYSNLQDVPERVVGVVLGAPVRLEKSENNFLDLRIKAAAELFHAQKVQYLIVSGADSHQALSEPKIMKDKLIKLGVPAEKIYRDDAGYRTLDSILRAQKNFGLDEFTIISQTFHNQRALYIAKRHGMSGVIAYNAKSPSTAKALQTYFREAFARVMTVLDVEFFKNEAREQNGEVRIGESTPPHDRN